MSLSPDLQSIQQARDLVETASKAQKLFKEATQEQVDKIVKAMAEAGEAHAERLARLAVDDTKMGRYEDKILKNLFGSRTLYEYIKNMKTVGIISKSPDGKVWEIAEPMGVVAALIPTTNPTSTAIYKAIIAVKSRNAIVMAPHPRAVACTAEAAQVMVDAATRAGAPKGLINCITEVSIAGTEELMKHKLTNVILATGSSQMVRAAQSTGKPAYGVGSGNVPAYIDRTAHVDKAVRDIITGCSFDNGNLCSSERSIIVDAPVKQQVLEAFKKYKAAYLSPDDVKKLQDGVVPAGKLNTETVGQLAVTIAKMCGISVPADTRVLIAEIKSVGKQDPLSMETLSPLLSMFTVNGWEEGCQRSMEILNFGGIGHTMVLHANDEKVITEFALKKPAMRILVNTVSSLGAVGLTTALPPAMTLGCGTWGGSITADNIMPYHLLNTKRVAFEVKEFKANWMDGSSLPNNESKTSAKSRMLDYKPTFYKENHAAVKSEPNKAAPTPSSDTPKSWMDEIDARIREKAGNPVLPRPAEKQETKPEPNKTEKEVKSTTLPLTDHAINSLIQKFAKK